MKMRMLLDTHIVIWLSTEPSRVPDRLQKLVLEADQRFISVVSFFEVALKHRKDSGSFPFTFEFLSNERNGRSPGDGIAIAEESH